MKFVILIMVGEGEVMYLLPCVVVTLWNLYILTKKKHTALKSVMYMSSKVCPC